MGGLGPVCRNGDRLTLGYGVLRLREDDVPVRPSAPQRLLPKDSAGELFCDVERWLSRRVRPIGAMGHMRPPAGDRMRGATVGRMS